MFGLGALFDLIVIAGTQQAAAVIAGAQADQECIDSPRDLTLEERASQSRMHDVLAVKPKIQVGPLDV